VIRKSGNLQQDLIIITGVSLILVLDTSLEEEVWKLDSSCKKYRKILDHFYVFQGVTRVANALAFGTLTSELFILKLLEDGTQSTSFLSDPQFRGIHKFKFQNTSISDIVSVDEAGYLGEVSLPSNELVLAFSNSKCLKLKLSSDLSKVQIASSFEFTNTFTSVSMMSFLTIANQVLLVTGNINGTLSFLDYVSFRCFLHFTLFSKSITCLSVSAEDPLVWKVYAGSNDGYGKTFYQLKSFILILPSYFGLH
jgi:hypothetical protein